MSGVHAYYWFNKNITDFSLSLVCKPSLLIHQSQTEVSFVLLIFFQLVSLQKFVEIDQMVVKILH